MHVHVFPHARAGFDFPGIVQWLSCKPGDMDSDDVK